MDSLVKEVSEIANLLNQDSWDLTDSQTIKVAVEIQRNRILEDALVVNKGLSGLGALEAIAMALGANEASSIKDALYKIAQGQEQV